MSEQVISAAKAGVMVVWTAVAVIEMEPRGQRASEYTL